MVKNMVFSGKTHGFWFQCSMSLGISGGASVACWSPMVARLSTPSFVTGQVMMPSQVVAGQSWNRAENGEKNRWISGNPRESLEIYIWLGIKDGKKSWEILDGKKTMFFMFIPKQD